MKFAEMTAPALRKVSREETLIVAPIAACEQHSRHLPVFTDAILVGAVADIAEAALPGQVLMLPVLWMGASDHHLPFGGTLTAPLPVYESMLIELLRPLLKDGFRRIMLLNGHGGNIDPLHVALRRLNNDYPDAILTGAAYWEIAQAEIGALCEGPRKVMGHACEIETSMIMHLRPDLVQTAEILDDPCPTPEGMTGLFWARDFAQATDHGAVGYPEQANAARGAKMLQAAGQAVAAACKAVLGLPLPGK
ncbi:creatininase family protein [Isosphaeraceae bacterium EP7]